MNTYCLYGNKYKHHRKKSNEHPLGQPSNEGTGTKGKDKKKQILLIKLVKKLVKVLNNSNSNKLE